MVNPTPSTPLLPRTFASFPKQTLLWRTGAIFALSTTTLHVNLQSLHSCLHLVDPNIFAASVGVIAGAFGAHGLRNRPGMTPDKIHAWETASSYAVYNGLALLLVSLHPRFGAHRFAGPAIAAGGFIFSSSIMALVLARDRYKFLGPITPMGGMVMIAGYISLIF